MLKTVKPDPPPTVGAAANCGPWRMADVARYLGMSYSVFGQIKTQKHIGGRLWPGPPFRTTIPRTGGLPIPIYNPVYVKHWCCIPHHFDELMRRWQKRQRQNAILRNQFPPFYNELKSDLERIRND